VLECDADVAVLTETNSERDDVDDDASYRSVGHFVQLREIFLTTQQHSNMSR